MNVLCTKRKDFFRPLRKVSLGLLLVVTSSAHAASLHQPASQSARQQVNNLVINQAGKDVDAIAQQKKWQDYTYQLNIFIPPAIASQPRCSSPLIISEAPYELKSLSHLNYEVTCPDAAGWHINVPVKPDVYVPVVMPRTEIERGTELTADQLVLKKYNVSNQHTDLVMNIDDVLGMTSKRTLQPLKPLTRAQLQSPILVTRDQEVMIVSHLGEITAQTAGIAMKNGRKGDVIKVRNASSQRIISATVDDTGVVQAINVPENMQ